MDHFKNLQRLLAREKQADKEAYQQQMSGSSLAERRANGVSWYPVAIRGSEMGRGDYLTVELERTTHTDLPHQLRFGAAAVLFSNHDPAADRLEGTISWQSGDRLKLSLRCDDLPDWTRDGKLGIDLLFDNNSYEEMESALQRAAQLISDGDAGPLVRVLAGTKNPEFTTAPVTAILPGLNAMQQQACLRILEAKELAIVHGPPGTGKTTTLVQAIKTLIAHGDQKILVVAPSNTAVDLLAEKLAVQGLNVIRIGNPVRVSEHLNALTADARMSAHPMMKDIRKMRKQADAFRDMAHKYKRQFGKAEREQRKALFDEARKIIKDVTNTEQYILKDLLDKAQVIAATPVGSDHYMVRHLEYDTVVIDEAGQAIEPVCWIPALKGKKLVLAGDHQQLPPTIKSAEAAREGLAVTLMERCVQQYPETVILLEEQYRMHETIMGYASQVFYHNRLRAHASVAGHLLFAEDKAVVFIDTAGCGFEEKQEGTAISNPEEAAFAVRQLSSLLEQLMQTYETGSLPSAGVIAPYRRQVELLQELSQHSEVCRAYGPALNVNTIDSFQGQERDLIYISLTRSNDEGQLGFLTDTRRMNVAMTRARKKLVVIGDSATLSRLPFYADFIDYVTQNNGYVSAWEYMG